MRRCVTACACVGTFEAKGGSDGTREEVEQCGQVILPGGSGLPQREQLGKRERDGAGVKDIMGAAASER